MQIDRAAFLVLTAALSASCRPPAVAPEVVEVAPGVTPPPEPSAPPPASTSPAPAVAVPDDDGEVPYETWPGTAVVPLAKTIRGKRCDPSENARGAPPACALAAPPGPACESFSDTRRECPRLGRSLVPRVAEAAVRCLTHKSGTTDICLFNVGAACTIAALDEVCVDDSPAIEQACVKVMDECAEMEPKFRHMNLHACKAALSAIVPSRHPAFLHCAAESCDLVACHYAATGQ